MQLKGFLERDTAALHKDVAVGLTKFEQKLCVHFSRVEIRGKRGRKVAVLLSPDMVDALTHIISRRTECGVPEENTFLFVRPNCLSPYRGQDCLRIYANECGAQNPELLRSTQLRKHVATLSQVLNLKNHELDQVADFLGHDIISMSTESITGFWRLQPSWPKYLNYYLLWRKVHLQIFRAKH